METWQKERIKQNLVNLCENTNCNAHLITILTSCNVFGKMDADVLENSLLLPFEKSKRFYEIIQTKSNSYDALLRALERTKQTGALNYLKTNQNQTDGHGETSKTTNPTGEKNDQDDATFRNPNNDQNQQDENTPFMSTAVILTGLAAAGNLAYQIFKTTSDSYTKKKPVIYRPDVVP